MSRPRSIAERVARSTRRAALANFIAALPEAGAIIIVPDHRLRLLLSARIQEARDVEAERFWFILATDAPLADIRRDAERHGLPVIDAPGLGLTRARRRAYLTDLRAA